MWFLAVFAKFSHLCKKNCASEMPLRRLYRPIAVFASSLVYLSFLFRCGNGSQALACRLELSDGLVVALMLFAAQTHQARPAPTQSTLPSRAVPSNE